MGPAAPGGRHAPSERQIIATVALAGILAPLNSTMIVVALPSVADSFGVSTADAAWLLTAYLVVMASLLPLAGKAGDVLGRRPLMLGGLAVFGLASVAAGAAPAFGVLLVARVLQAVAIAVVLPNAMALVREVAAPERRGAAFGLLGAALGLAAAAGPPLGGLLTELVGWRAIFFVNMPVVVVALALGIRFLPAIRPAAGRVSFDAAGAVLAPLTLAALVVALMAAARGDPPAVIASGAAVFVMLGAALVWQERRHPDPIVPLGLFRVRAFGAAAAGVAFSNMAMYLLLVVVPLLLAARGGYTALEVGAILAALSVTMAAMGPVGGRLSDRLGRRVPAAAGLGLLGIATLALAIGGGSVPIVVLVPALATAGLGLGVANPGVQTAAVESVPPERAGVAAGLFSTGRYLGSIVGTAILAGLIGADRGGTNAAGAVFVLAFAAAALSAVAVLGLRARPLR